MQNYQIKLFFTTKEDGNLAFHVDDAKENVLTNHKKLAKKLNYNLDNLVHMKQIHSDIVHIVNDDDNFNNPPTCDALITNKKHTPLMVMVADCTPIIFYDIEESVIAVAHVGRAGAFKNIIENTISKMKTNFKSNTKNIKVNIGSSIGACCYKVGSEIYDETKRLNLQYAIKKEQDDYYLDISKIIYTQLKDANISSNNITSSTECSCCFHEKFYSYRYNQQTGRYAGIIYLS